MIFALAKASSDYIGHTIEINSLEELLDFKEKNGHDLIIQDNFFYNNIDCLIEEAQKIKDIKEFCQCKYEILIYDDYIE